MHALTLSHMLLLHTLSAVNLHSGTAVLITMSSCHMTTSYRAACCWGQQDTLRVSPKLLRVQTCRPGLCAPGSQSNVTASISQFVKHKTPPYDKWWCVQGNSAAFEMEYCCTDLGTVLRAARAAGGGVLPPAAVKDLMHQLLSGLRAVHETGQNTRCPEKTSLPAARVAASLPPSVKKSVTENRPPRSSSSRGPMLQQRI